MLCALGFGGSLMHTFDKLIEFLEERPAECSPGAKETELIVD